MHAGFDFVCHDFRHYLVEEQKHFVGCLRLDLALIDKVVKRIDEGRADARLLSLSVTLHQLQQKVVYLVRR